VDLVAQPGALLDERPVLGDLAAEGPGREIGNPDRRDEVSGQQLGQGLGVDLVGLDLGTGDRFGPQRIGDRHRPGVGAEQVGDRPGVRGGLEHDLIIWAEGPGKVPQRLGFGRQAQPAFLLPLEDRDLREVPMNVETDGPHRWSFFLDTGRATRQLRIRARSATGQVARAAK
jgi:hypothetical protein